MPLVRYQPALEIMANTIKKHVQNPAQYEAVLDDFFSMYGYKVNRVKDIELHSRKNWNYVKTVGANITGNIPAGDLAEITHIFDSGVTMWHTKSFDYGNLDNPIMV